MSREELAAWTAGDCQADVAAQLAEHVASCPRCSRRVEALREVDRLLKRMPRQEPSAAVLGEARAEVMRSVRAACGPEVMTLDEVASFLRVSPDELGEVASDLPLFELAGRLRMRRSKLMEWIESRERRFARQRTETQVAGIMAGRFGGVA